MSTTDRPSSATTPHPTPTAEWYTFDDTASCVVQWGERRATLYRSPTGRSFRIWVDGVEWKPVENGSPSAGGES